MRIPPQLVIHIQNHNDEGRGDWVLAFDSIGVKTDSLYGDILVESLKHQFSSKLPVTLLFEMDYTDKDFRSIFYRHYSKVFRKIDRQSIRCHIFQGMLEEKRLLPPALITDIDYLGYFCVSILDRPLLGRTMIKFNAKNPRDYICKTTFESRIFGSRCTVECFPFIWQDGEMICCAHASLWMIHRYFSTRYDLYREALPHEILWSDDTPTRRLIPSTGLDIEQLGALMSKLGYYPEVILNESTRSASDESDNQKEKVERFFFGQLHSYIESRIPLIAFSKRLEHAVVIIGRVAPDSQTTPPLRTFKESEFDEISYWDSSDFCRAYIVNDDNYFPYKIWERRNFENDNERTANDIDGIIVPLYEKIFLSADLAMKNGLYVISSREYGLNAMSIYSLNPLIKKILPADKTLVIRTLLTSSKTYLRHIAEKLPSTASAHIIRLMNLPKFVWVIEITDKEAFINSPVKMKTSNHTDGLKFGEVLIDATAGKDFNNAWLCIRYPGIIRFNPLALGNEFNAIYPIPIENDSFPEPLLINSF